MRKITAMIITMATISLVACAGYADMTAKAVTRTEPARFYTAENGTIKTKDGNIWSYQTETLDDAFKCSDGSIMFTGIQHKAKNNVPVWVRINDKGTPENITDDEILKVGLDFCAYMDEVIAANDAYIAELQAKYAK